MKNFKRLIALFLVVAMMATISVAPTASSHEAWEQLEMIGLLQGSEDGLTNEYLYSSLTRMQLAILYARLVGIESEAYGFVDWRIGSNYADYVGIENESDVIDWSMSSNFADYNDKTSAVEQNMLAFFYGDPSWGFVGTELDSTTGRMLFAPQEAATNKMLLKILLVAMGYPYGGEYDWNNIATFGRMLGIDIGSSEMLFDMHSVSEIIVEALEAKMSNGDYFGRYLIDEGILDEELVVDYAGIRIYDWFGLYEESEDVIWAYEPDMAAPTPQTSYYDYSMAPTFNTEEYGRITERGFISPFDAPLSTFSSSVDTASYSLVRAKMRTSGAVTPDMVKIEEFVNYFKYDYPAPTGAAPLATYAELGPCQWADGHMLLQIGVQAEKIDFSDAPPCNLVFLIDISGSMQVQNKLPLVRQSFMLLAENLRDIDRVSIVTYANGQDTLIEGATGEDRSKIMSVIESLEAGGYTNGAGGIEAAYKCAERNYIEGGINRVLLATDGDFNVGVTSEGDLSRLISEKRDTGIFLSVMGFGMGNYKDNKMETLAKDGNGNAYYIDSLLEARRVLVEQMSATLNTVAKDVKLQVEFNPEHVKAYRLIGYENRMLNSEDFDDDSVDGGEVGSGHSVTALYEIIPMGSDEETPAGTPLKYQYRRTTQSDEMLSVAVRYKLPDSDESSLIDLPVTRSNYKTNPSDNFLWASAVAEFALYLRQSEYAPEASADNALKTAKSTNYLSDPYRLEFVDILENLR